MLSNSSASVDSTGLVPDSTPSDNPKKDLTSMSKKAVATSTASSIDNIITSEQDQIAETAGATPPTSSLLSSPDPSSTVQHSKTSFVSTSTTVHMTAAPQDELNQNNKRVISLTAQWNGKRLPFEVDLDYTIGELKNKLMELTNVEPKRQKLMLVRGKLPEDHVVLSSLSLKDNQTFLMMGTPEAKVIKAPETLPDVLNDLDEDYTPDDEAFASMAANQKNLKSITAKCDINIMHPLRTGKRLLVLDLDYTLIDCKALNNPMIEVMRPGLHEFLAVCYEHYDIVIWSQTSWRALEAKVTTIGLLTHSDYKISFVMDITSMFSVMSQRDGKPFKHQVKALNIIWTKFPQYSAKNTIHIDDLSRNFAMNPKSGLKIGAFKNGAVSRHSDRELYHLAKYLVGISNNANFKELDHKSWKNHRKLNR
ncbi:hypothetical protein BGZ83_011091 [Gryganskiella cystojenkinii]|nr:hypothetical protein BGZ83_011091 [Gryganskiella cystojenkinii]